MRGRDERGRRGRPRGGVRPGERLRDYPTVSVRLPPGTRAMLRALCAQRRMPTWLMVRHLVICYVRDLPPRERRQVLERTRLAA